MKKIIFILFLFLSVVFLLNIDKNTTNKTSYNVKNSWLENLKNEEIDSNHRTDSLSMLILISLIIMSVFSAWILRVHENVYIHETGVSMLLGIISGGLIRLILHFIAKNEIEDLNVVTIQLINSKKLLVAPLKLILNISNSEYIYYLSGQASPNNIQNSYEELEEKSSFNPEVFFYVLLPPIVFFAGYQLKRNYFFRNIGSTAAFAFFGTTISTVVTGCLTYIYANYIVYIEGYDLKEAMLFGAIISATDPVTVLAIFQNLKVDHDLNALVFGESVFNDAVAIVLYRTILSYMNYESLGTKQLTLLSILIAVGNFIYIFIGSFIIGFGIACFTAILTKTTKIGMYPLLETALLILMSYSTFLIAEVINWSGIVAVLFCGISQKHYTYNNMSPATAFRFVEVFELIIFIGETFIFSYMGLSLFLFTDHNWNFSFIMVTCLILFIARAFNIYPISFFLNLKRSPKIPCNHQHLMTWSGLRGAMAFALAIRNTVSDIRKLMLSTTLAIVLISLFFQGSLTMAVLNLFKIKTGDQQNADGEEPQKLVWTSILPKNDKISTNDINEQFIETSSNNVYKSTLFSNDVIDDYDNKTHKPSIFIKAFMYVDENYLLPFLTDKK